MLFTYRRFVGALVAFGVVALYPGLDSGNAQESIRIERPRVPTVITSQPLRIVERDRATVSHVFKLGSGFGDREVFDIVLPRAGELRIRVDWRGTTDHLAVILNGPGQTGYYARRDGVAPLSIEFDVTEELLRRGANWRVSVVNFSRRGGSVGRMVMDYPAMVRPLARLSPSLRRIAEDAVTQPPAPAGESERKILSDGRVQVRYSDGRVVIYEPGCGYTTIFPDGTASTALCNQVQPASLPALPSDPALQGFLEGHRDHLLQQISKLVDYRQEEIDLYLGYESSNTDGLFQEIQMRMRLIDNLLQ